MKILPSIIVRGKNMLYTPFPWIALLEISLSESVQLYFCSNNEDVTFGGRVYTAFPFSLEAARQTSKGEIPTLPLKVCNVDRIIHSYLEQLDGAVGAEVVIRVVNSAHLAEDFSELDMTFSVLSTEADAEWVTFNLGAPSPLRQRFPRYRYIAMHCNWEFKSVECAYAGAETTCDRTFKRCDALANTRRFGGYHGLNLKGWRLT
ncbi:MAG: DUF1833 family protein [Desulfobacteraceae bacterium]|nr:DUF1833 family protein [Desulfobacteraceae bacterium]